MSKKLKPQKPSWWEEFKAFAVKGNAMALAVGTIIGAAFKTITDSLTNDVIMPVVNIFLGGTDFANMKIKLPRMPWVDPKYADVLNEAGEVIGKKEIHNYLTWGNFLSAVINFFILALVVFFLVKGLNRLADAAKKKEEEAPAEEPAPPAPSNEEVLLTEIRDLLKNK